MAEIGSLFKEIHPERLKPIYVFWGPEKRLYQSFEEKVIEFCDKSGFLEMNYSRFEGDDQVEAWIDSCETLPLFADRRVITVRGEQVLNQKLVGTPETHQRFCAYIQAPNPNACLLMYVETVDLRMEAVKLLQKNNMLYELSKLDAKALAKWFYKGVLAQGKDIEPDVLQSFIRQTGYLDKNSTLTLYDLQNQIHRVCQHSDTHQVTEVDIRCLVEKNTEHTVFELTDAMGMRNTAASLELLHSLLEAGENPLGLLAMIGRHIRQLKRVKTCTDMGYSMDMIAETCALKPFVVKKYQTQLARFTMPMLDYLMHTILETDFQLKQSGLTPEAALEMLTMKICFVHMLAPEEA